ncbi:MAG: class I SAM-dependent methyltransferase [Terriglobia bacterium]
MHRVIRRLRALANRPSDGADMVLRRVPPRSICAELGVYKGEFSAQILKTNVPRRLHLVDPWKFEPSPEYGRSWYGGAKGGSQENMDAIYDSVCLRFQSEISAGAVKIHRSPSAQVASQFPDGYFDWVYVDGNHQYEFVLRDLELYYPKVKSGGFITGDDYCVPGWWKDGVTKAVDHFMASGNCKKVEIWDHKFVLRKL